MTLDDCFAITMRFHTSRFGSGSETESEAGDLLDQQFEELNHKLTSAADPTGYLRMVSRNNLFNRSGCALGLSLLACGCTRLELVKRSKILYLQAMNMEHINVGPSHS